MSAHSFATNVGSIGMRLRKMKKNKENGLQIGMKKRKIKHRIVNIIRCECARRGVNLMKIDTNVIPLKGGS